jgi:phage gp29-like protein
MSVIKRGINLVQKLFRSKPLVGSASVLPELPLYFQYSRIGGNVTPARVSAILQSADAGTVNELVDLANESRQKDGHLQSVLSTRENALASLELLIEPAIAHGEEEATEYDTETAAMIDYALSCATGDGETIRSFHDLISQLNGGIYHGYAVSEIVWDVHDGMMVPTGFRPIDQRRFEFSLSDGRLRQKDTMSTFQGIDLQAEWPGKFIQHQPRVNGDVPAREGLSRLLVWAALFRNWGLSDWLKLAELSWKPWRIGIYSKQANDDDKEDLLAALRALTTNGVVVHREDHKLDFRWAGSNARADVGPHERLCEFLAKEMSKAVLGQTLTTDSGERGARSLGEVHDRVRKDIREQDAIAISSTLRRDLVSWIVKFNRGDDAQIPNVRFATDDATDLESFSGSVKNLTEAGAKISQAWVHDLIGHPEIDGETTLLGDSENAVEREPQEEAQAEEEEAQ